MPPKVARLHQQCLRHLRRRLQKAGQTGKQRRCTLAPTACERVSQKPASRDPVFCSVDRCGGDDTVPQENAVQVCGSREQVYPVGPQTLTVGSHMPFTPRCVSFPGSAIPVANWQICFVLQQTFNYQAASYACLTTSALSVIIIPCAAACRPRETMAVLGTRGSSLTSVLTTRKPRTRARPGPGG